jgi:hypothetical protein
MATRQFGVKRLSNYYTQRERARVYAPGEAIKLSRGRREMSIEQAAELGLVRHDPARGGWLREYSDPGIETAIVNEAEFRARLLAPLRNAAGPSGPTDGN